MAQIADDKQVVSRPTDVAALLDELGGHHAAILGNLLSQVAASVYNNGQNGEVNLKIVIKPSPHQGPSGKSVLFQHTVSYKRPKERGEISESDKYVTPVHINREGDVTLFPRHQSDAFPVSSASNVDKETGEIS